MSTSSRVAADSSNQRQQQDSKQSYLISVGSLSQLFVYVGHIKLSQA